MEKEYLLERGFELDQTHLNVNHAQVLLAVEVLTQNYVCWVEQHHALVLLGNLKKSRSLGVREYGQVCDLCIELTIRLVTSIL